MRGPFALALICAATTASAMLPPCAHDELVGGAVRVVHLTDLAVAPADDAGFCQITGRLARIWRGPGAEGELLSVAVPCLNREMIVGPTLWHDPAALEGMRAVELHLDQAGGVAGHGAGLLPLDAPGKAIVWRATCTE